MKVSRITIEDLALYLRLDFSDLTIKEVAELETMLTAAKSFIKSYTGLTEEKIDAHEDFVIVAYVLVQDMYDSRTMYVEKNEINKVVSTILGMHSINLL